MEYTDAELCALLRQLDREMDGPLTVKDVEDADEYPDHTTFERRFGSWNQAKQAAGLETIGKGKAGRDQSYTDEELLEQLSQLDRTSDRPLTKAAVNAADCPSVSTYCRRFSSWANAKREAGIET